MKRSAVIGLAALAGAWLATSASAKDLGSQDVLKLSQATFANGEYTVSIDVVNDQSLTAFDSDSVFVGTFRFDSGAGHGHWHFDAFIQYRLLR